MSSDVDTENNTDEIPKQAVLMSSDQVNDTQVTRWQFENLEQKEVQKHQKIRQEVIDQLRKEVAPEVEEQATLIKRQAFEEAQQKGYDEGFKQGVQSGKLEGKHQAEKDASEILQPQVKALQDMAEFMATPYQQISEEVFEQLAQVSLKIAEKIVEKEMSQHHDWVLKAVNKAIERLPKTTETIEINVNPDDLMTLETYGSEHNKAWKLVADESIVSGACRVNLHSSTVVNDWKEQLEYLIEDTFAVAQNLSNENTPEAEDSAPNRSSD